MKNQPRGWILSQIGANWTGFVAFFDLDRGTTVADMVGTLSMGQKSRGWQFVYNMFAYVWAFSGGSDSF